MIEALENFRSYLVGHKSKIIIDRSTVQNNLDKKDVAVKVSIQALFIIYFKYEVVHRPKLK